MKLEIRKLQELQVEVELSWSPGHANIKENEYADRLAKEAAQDVKDAEDLQAGLWNNSANSKLGT